MCEKTVKEKGGLATDVKKIINMLLEIYTSWKAAANLTVYSLCIDTYATNTEKESKLS